MTHPILKAMFDLQKNRFRQLLIDEGRKNLAFFEAGKGPPSDALSFAEMLMLCPTEDSVIAHILRHPREAQVFCAMTEIAGGEFEQGKTEYSIEITSESVPFLILAYAVKCRTEHHIAEAGDKWD